MRYLIDVSFAELGIKPVSRLALRFSEKNFRELVVAFVRRVNSSDGFRPVKGLEAAAGVVQVGIDGDMVQITTDWERVD